MENIKLRALYIDLKIIRRWDVFTRVNNIIQRHDVDINKSVGSIAFAPQCLAQITRFSEVTIIRNEGIKRGRPRAGLLI